MANIVKRSTVRRTGVHDATIGNGRLEDKTILSTNNKATITTRKVTGLSRRGQEHNEMKNALSAGLLRRVLGNACSTKNGASLGSVCSKQSKLAHIRRMDLPIIIIWVSPLSFLGASGVIFKFYSIFR